MTLETHAAVDTAAQAVHQLIAACRKGGALVHPESACGGAGELHRQVAAQRH
jgi:hypothetical protein